MRVLITNDDGIEAKGLQELRRALVAVPDLEVNVVAPDSNRSATARSITTRSPLWVEEIGFDDGGSGYACDGTPVDCVRFAELGLIGERPELIVSGINHGANLGDDITYSGTVAAALEGIVLGIPAIAISQQSALREMDFQFGRDFDFSVAAAFAAQLVERVARDGLPADTLLNVNCPAGAPSGIEVSHLGKRLYNDELKLVEEDPEQRAAPVPDLRLRALVRGRGGLGPVGDRQRAHRGHARPLRPHRPFGPRPAARLGLRRDAGGRPLMAAPAKSKKRAERAAQADRQARSPLLRAGRSGDLGHRVRRPAAGAAGDRGGQSRSWSRPTRRPSGSAAPRWRSSGPSPTPSRCCPSATPATRMSSAPGRNGSSATSSAWTSAAARSNT